MRVTVKDRALNKVYDLSDLFSPKKCIAAHLEMVATRDTFLREQIVNTLGKRLGNEGKQLHFR